MAIDPVSRSSLTLSMVLPAANCLSAAALYPDFDDSANDGSISFMARMLSDARSVWGISVAKSAHAGRPGPGCATGLAAPRAGAVDVLGAVVGLGAVDEA